MLHVVRNLVVKTRPDIASDKFPKGVIASHVYQVIGYTTRKKKLPNSDMEVEEVGTYIIINENDYLTYIWPSQCETQIDNAPQ